MLIDLLLKWKGVPTSHELLDRMPPDLKDLFSREATLINDTKYHKWLMEDLELMAERWMMRGNKEDMLVAKGILYCLNVQQKNISKMKLGNLAQDSPEKKRMRRFN